jgi:hypothetical protein
MNVSNLTHDAKKIESFLALFQGRRDVVAEHWISKKSGKSGYAPICANKFKRPVCILGKGGRCDDCEHVVHTKMDTSLLKQHFTGNKILGIYPLMPDNTTHFLAFDFDRHKPTEPDPLQDAVALVETCEDQDLPAFMERSKSGDGYHVWLFFDEAIPAERARLIGRALLEEADVYEVKS